MGTPPPSLQPPSAHLNAPVKDEPALATKEQQPSGISTAAATLQGAAGGGTHTSTANPAGDPTHSAGVVGSAQTLPEDTQTGGQTSQTQHDTGGGGAAQVGPSGAIEGAAPTLFSGASTPKPQRTLWHPQTGESLSGWKQAVSAARDANHAATKMLGMVTPTRLAGFLMSAAYVCPVLV